MMRSSGEREIGVEISGEKEFLYSIFSGEVELLTHRGCTQLGVENHVYLLSLL